MFPEMPRPRTPEGKSKPESVTETELAAFIEKGDLEFLGGGFEARVVALKEHPDIALAYSFWNPSEDFDGLRAKTTFYIQRILSTIFPHNFPKIYAAFGSEGEKIGEKTRGTVRQRIIPGKPEQIYIENTLDYALTQLQTMGIKDAYLFFDPNPKNLMVTEDGHEYFVDTPNTFPINKEGASIRTVFAEAENNILQWMKIHSYSMGNISIVKNSIGRLKSLDREAKKKEKDG